jgi:quercetin dioxygenase-like cupin family protein
MDRYNWHTIPEEKLNDLVSRQVMHTAQSTIARISLKKGAVVPLHRHVNEQVSMVKSGALQFETGGERFMLGSGDVLVIPPDTPHRVEALEDSLVTDLFTPARADWIRGDDAYLRKGSG